MVINPCQKQMLLVDYKKNKIKLEVDNETSKSFN